ALPALNAQIKRIEANIIPMFTEQRNVADQIAATPLDSRKDLLERKDQLDKRLRGRQWALVTIALAIRDISSCPQRANQKCIANFDEFQLKDMELVGVR